MSFLKASFAASAAAVVSVSGAQQPTNPFEQEIWNAYTKLQADSQFSLSMSGSRTVEGQTRTFQSTLYFNLSNDPRTNALSYAKLELDTFDTTGVSAGSSAKLPILTQRAVGDGENLWVYNLPEDPSQTPTYSVSFYSFYGKARTVPADGVPVTSDAPRLLAQLNSQVQGPAQYMVRLLREVNHGGTTRYENWAPGEIPVQSSLTPPLQDPLVPSWAYISLPTLLWVAYGPAPQSNPFYYRFAPTRSVAFELSNGSVNAGSPDWRLAQINFAQQSGNTFTQWIMNFHDPNTEVPQGAFLPYSANMIQGWRPLNVKHAYSG